MADCTAAGQAHMSQATLAELQAPDSLSIAHHVALSIGEAPAAPRRGIYTVENEPDLQALYGNVPYTEDKRAREEELRRIRERFEREGIMEVAHRTYPRNGSDSGYTFALLLQTPAGNAGLVKAIANGEAMKTPGRSRASAGFEVAGVVKVKPPPKADGDADDEDPSAESATVDTAGVV